MTRGQLVEWFCRTGPFEHWKENLVWGCIVRTHIAGTASRAALLHCPACFRGAVLRSLTQFSASVPSRVYVCFQKTVQDHHDAVLSPFLGTHTSQEYTTLGAVFKHKVEVRAPATHPGPRCAAANCWGLARRGLTAEGLARGANAQIAHNATSRLMLAACAALHRPAGMRPSLR